MPLAASTGCEVQSCDATWSQTGRVASNAGIIAARAGAMDSDVSDFTETDADILTFDVPDEALERAAGGVALVLTLALCTNDWYNCTWPQ